MAGLSDGLIPRFSPTMEDSDKTCRVCRSGEEPGSPLYKPCKCSGSISWIHQDCLESWLSVSRAQRCELCKHPFKWDKVYASQAPAKLPAQLIIRHLIRSLISGSLYLIRFLFVAFIWLAFLPYSILWVWRGLFHLAKGWGTSWTAAIQEVEWSTVGLSSIFMPHQDQVLRKNATMSAAAQAAASITSAATARQTVNTQDVHSESTIMTLSRMINGTIVSTSMKPKVEALEDAIADLFKAWRKPEYHTSTIQQAVVNATKTVKNNSNANVTSSWLPRSAFLDRALTAGSEVVSSKWKAHKNLLYSMGEDIFSGQVIVACVIIAFIAAFLLREWVMANQPHAHAAQDQVQAPPVVDVVRQQALIRERGLQEAVDRFRELNERREREGQVNETLPFQIEGHRAIGMPLDELLADNAEHQEQGPSDHHPQEEDTAASRAASPAYYSQSFERAASPRAVSPTPSDEEASAGLIRRRAWSSERDLGDREGQTGSPAGFTFSPMRLEASLPSQDFTSEASTSGATSPLNVTTRPRSASNDFGIDSASDGELENNPPAAAAQLGPAPAPVNPARRPARAHDLGNDSDSEDDEDDDLWGAPDPLLGAAGPAVAAGAPAAQDDPVLFEGEENPDDLFFEADLQGILEAIGINGPILALLQNVALVSLLIACLLVVAVWVPLMLGKTIAATNAQKIFLLPINFVRLFTDPVADRLIGAVATPQKEAAPVPTLKGRLMTAFGKLSSSSSATKQETLFQRYLDHSLFHIQPYFDSIRTAITASLSGIAKAIKQQWYSMAVGDSNTDRTLCIALGYCVIIGAAGVYLHHTKNTQAREAGAAVRDIVKQHFTLVKAASFFFIEIVFFPAMCGLLINLSTLPLIPGATLSTRLDYYLTSPGSAIFLTWLAGTNFMFSFAQAISIVRKCIRKGVLYFIRDPSDPEANPLREILETPAVNQAKKISRSLLVYGGIVLTCFGFFPWASRLVPLGLFPLRWDMTRPLSVVPWDLIYLLTIVPITIGRAKPKRAIRRLVRKWCKITAHQLRLSSFMLGKRIPDEEGTHVRRTWRAWLLLKKAPIPTTTNDDENENKKTIISDSTAEVIFRKDGGFARTVAADNVKIIAKKMFVRVNKEGEALSEEGKEAIESQLKDGNNDESKFTIVYIPPHFKSRILLFIYLLWLTCSVGIFVAVCTPLIIGRVLLDLVFKEALHDTYSLIVGIHAISIATASYKSFNRRVQIYSRYKRHLSLYSLGAHPFGVYLRMTSLKIFHGTLFFFNVGILLPLLVGTTIWLYILFPLEMLFGGFGSAEKTFQLSFTMQWCLGVSTVRMIIEISKLMRENWISRLVREADTLNPLEQAKFLNKQVLRMNRTLLLGIMMPLAVTYSHRLTVRLIWRYLLQGKGAPPTNEGQAYIFKIALLSVSFATLGVLLANPMKKLIKKWIEKVWEKEFVIKRKLRNIDDDDDTIGAGTGNEETERNGNEGMQVEGMLPIPPELDVVD